eukprot:2052560-Lingulodinium_polyedra.AAC.1
MEVRMQITRANNAKHWTFHAQQCHTIADPQTHRPVGSQKRRPTRPQTRAHTLTRVHRSPASHFISVA